MSSPAFPPGRRAPPPSPYPPDRKDGTHPTLENDSMNPRFALLTATAFLALAMLAPHAEAWGNWTGETHRYFIPGATNWSHAYRTYANGGQAHIYDSGYVTYSFTQAHANGLAPDVIRFRMSEQWASGSCWYQIIAYPGGIVYDTGWGGCGWGIDVHHAPTTNNVQYDIKISYLGVYDTAKITYVEVLAIWESAGTYGSAPYYRPIISSDTSSTPGSCMPIHTWTSRMHTTLLEVDWGDGFNSVYNPAPDGNPVQACHSYAPSAVPFQMCFRLRETNGLQRTSPTECHSMYWSMRVI